MNYDLANDDLLEFDAQNGLRGLCHLLIFIASGNCPVCVLGNFEGPVGPATGGAIESVATAVSDRLGGEDFRLIEWYPHTAQTQHRFTEVRLTPVLPTAIPAGGLLISGEDLAPRSQRTLLVRFIDPEWRPLSEDCVAALLGEPAIRELRSYAGLPGDYTPERVFASTGRSSVATICEHNQRTWPDPLRSVRSV